MVHAVAGLFATCVHTVPAQHPKTALLITVIEPNFCTRTSRHNQPGCLYQIKCLVGEIFRSLCQIALYPSIFVSDLMDASCHLSTIDKGLT